MPLMKTSGIAILFSLVLIWTSFTSAQKIVSPDDHFLTLKTAHFEIIFNAKQQKLGEHYARQLEKAHQFLTERFSISPEKTIVLINDNTDSTNGYATPLPYPHMVIYPVLPVTQEALGEGSDWSLELLTHEYTHILSFYPATGFMKVLKALFGTVVAPNLLMPRWWLEGVAVYNESTVAQGGRLRSLYQEGTLRSMVHAGTLNEYDMGEINEIIPTWPASRPYLFGSIFWAAAVEKSGTKIMNDLTENQAGRVPYFLESPARSYLGSNYTPFYNQALADLKQRLDKQIQSLESAPLSTTKPLSVNDYIPYHKPRIAMAVGPSISPSGKFLAFIATDEYYKKSVRIYAREPGEGNFAKPIPFEAVESAFDEQESKTLDNLPTGAIQRISWFHTSDKIVYDKIDRVSSFETYSDLHIFDLQTRKNKKLTKKLRAREPSVSSDDLRIVYVQLTGGQTSLATYDLTTNRSETLFTSEFDETLSHPIFWSSDEILFAHRQKTGIEVLRIYKISTRELRTLYPEFSPSRFPIRFQNKLYFVSGKNQVFNIYETPDLETNPRPVSHLIGGALSYTRDPLTQNFAASVMTEKGPQLQILSPLNSAKELPSIEKVFQPQTAPYTESPQQTAAATQTQLEATPYSPWSYLIPRYWIPWIGTSTAHNGLIWQATTGAFDPLQRHNYSLTASYDSYLRRGSGSLNYLNNTMETSVLLSSSYKNSFLVRPEDLISTQAYSLSVLPDLFSINANLLAQAGILFEENEVFDRKYQLFGGQILLGYSNSSMTLAQVVPDEGKNIVVGFRQTRDQTRGIDLSQFVFYGNYFESHFLPRFHGLRLRTSGLVTTTEVSSFYGKISQAYPGSASEFLMRGYRTGQFLGRTALNANIEYQFPLFDLYRGSGTDPYFFRRVHGAIIGDHGRVDGSAYNEKLKSYETVNTGKGFNNVGAELRLDLTLGYVLPLQFVLGYYQPLEKDYTKDTSILGLQVRGMGLP